jgi:hypothetical protein
MNSTSRRSDKDNSMRIRTLIISTKRVTGHNVLTPNIKFARSFNERNRIRTIDRLVRRLLKAAEA